MKVRWFGTFLFLLTQVPAPIWAQTLPEVLPGTSGVASTSPSTSQQLDASENENNTNEFPSAPGVKPGRLTVLPEDGRGLYFSAIDGAKNQIRIEICVLEDPQILQHLQAALARGVRVRVIVDRGKYSSLDAEQQNLALYLTSAGGQLHLSNPMFPRSFPKIILIDSKLLVYGSACLDETTFMQYRDFATANADLQILDELERLFQNDWTYSAEVGQPPPPFNPTARISGTDLMISPVNSADRLVRLYQKAKRTLDVYTELLGNLTLESELFAAVKRGV